MEVTWTSKALSDLVRLHEFLVPVNKPAAARVVRSLVAAPTGLLVNPRLGEKQSDAAAASGESRSSPAPTASSSDHDHMTGEDSMSDTPIYARSQP